MNNKFNMYSSEYIMSTHLQPLEFFIDKMLCKGLYILAGAPKIGKSWLALDMCLSVAEEKLKIAQANACAFISCPCPSCI